MNSIRGRLLFWQITALALTALLVSAITYSVAWSGFNRLRNENLEQIAYSIVRHGVEPAAKDAPDVDEADRGQFASQIWNADGGLAYSSLASGGPPPQKAGYHVIHWNGEDWNLYTLKDGNLTIQVGTPATYRRALFARVVPWLLLPFSVLVATLGAFIWVAVGRALAPLESIRGELERRDPRELAPIQLLNLPEEVAPLVQALNALLSRLDAALAGERRFIADAAHALRTPLTAIKLQAQLADRGASAEERRAALAQLDAGVDRAAHLVEQLLRMARLEHGSQEYPFARIRLDELAKAVVSAFSSLADARGIDLGVTVCQPLTLSGHGDSLRALLDNLVDNALRYGQRGERVDIGVRADGAYATLSVIDHGPGIPASERGRVFDRFYRLAGANQPGSGLGLAIARSIAQLHGGRIDLAPTPGGGLTVIVRLPHPEANIGGTGQVDC